MGITWLWKRQCQCQGRIIYTGEPTNPYMEEKYRLIDKTWEAGVFSSWQEFLCVYECITYQRITRDIWRGDNLWSYIIEKTTKGQFAIVQNYFCLSFVTTAETVDTLDKKLIWHLRSLATSDSYHSILDEPRVHYRTLPKTFAISVLSEKTLRQYSFERRKARYWDSHGLFFEYMHGRRDT